MAITGSNQQKSRQGAPVKCPVCGTWTIVKETRTSTGNTRRRRMECANEHRFTTLETIVDRKTPIRQKQKTAEDGGKS